MHAFDVFRQYERNHWELSDIDFTAIDRSEVRPEYITLAKSAVMGECNSIAATHGFFNEFVDDYDFSAFACIWGYQELQHHYAFKAWLNALEVEVDQRPVDAMRAPYAPGSTPSATLATNIISELTVNHIYREVAQWVKEPVLNDILSRASRDEAGHAREFIHYTRTRLARLPHELPSVLETLYVYTSEARIKHPVGLFKDSLVQGVAEETIDTGFEIFLEKVAADGELERLHRKVRGAFGSMTGLELDTGAQIRRALAEAIA
ncbi:ferritin-like domain-containing protein [Streptomyces monticola]|uniref:Ferritin-like domain-containing protein n=1 Tax=Streptomyces monticola TaxID=2666263 RepID=A0ABW2JEE4_9ACTN